MRIVSVLERKCVGNVTLNSFPIPDESKVQVEVDKAEKLFMQKAMENGADTNDEEDLLDNGYYENESTNYELYLIWSD